MKFNIMHRFNGSVVFEAEIQCDDGASYGVRLGLAVKAALASKADLSKADLSWADLSEADLSKADLSKADLSEADLSWADLSEADLSWANLSKANLSKADLSWANLSEADLSKADLSEADLSWANLSEANLSEANLSKANLSWADLRIIKHDIWGIIAHAIPEVPALRAALMEGRVSGSTYSGECACLCGTIANTRGVSPYTMEGIQTDANSPAERFFLAIRKGDTPETSQPAKLALQWIDEFMALIGKGEAA